MVESVENLFFAEIYFRKGLLQIVTHKESETVKKIDDEDRNTDEMHQAEGINHGHHIYRQGSDLRTMLQKLLHGQGHGQILPPDGSQKLVDVLMIGPERTIQDNVKDNTANFLHAQSNESHAQINDFLDAAIQRRIGACQY